jgi:hypothetical protein
MTQTWKSRQKRKAKHANGGNTQKKGDNCQTDGQKKFFLSSPKAYKHRDYAKWHALAYRLNKQDMPKAAV